jgi:hypothetical protein
MARQCRKSLIAAIFLQESKAFGKKVAIGSDPIATVKTWVTPEPLHFLSPVSSHNLDLRHIASVACDYQRNLHTPRSP